jgi:two-component system KDP operon response regulator KdpE
MQHKNVPLTHARTLRTIWVPQYGDEPDHLRSYAKTLRKKIEDEIAHLRYLVTGPRVGYRFRDPTDPGGLGATAANDAEDDE